MHIDSYIPKVPVTGLWFIYRNAWGLPYNISTGQYELWSDVNYGAYRVSATQQGTSGTWTVVRPSGVQPPFSITFRKIVDGTLANDTPLDDYRQTQPTRSSAFGPMLAPNNLLWQDVQDIGSVTSNVPGTTPCVNNGVVGNFMDQSGNGFDFTASVFQPIYLASGINGWPSIRFTAASFQALSGGNPGKMINLGKSSFTWAAMIQPTIGQTLGTIFSKNAAGGSNSAKIWFAHVFGNPNYGNLPSFVNYQWFWSGTTNPKQGIIPLGRPAFLMYQWELDQFEEDSGLVGLPFGRHKLWINGRLAAVHSTTDVTFDTTANWMMGADALPGHYFDGMIGFNGLWAGLLDRRQRTGLCGYAASRWGAKIEATDPRRFNEYDTDEL